MQICVYIYISTHTCVYKYIDMYICIYTCLRVSNAANAANANAANATHAANATNATAAAGCGCAALAVVAGWPLQHQEPLVVVLLMMILCMTLFCDTASIYAVISASYINAPVLAKSHAVCVLLAKLQIPC